MRTVPTFTFSILTLASLEAAAALSATVPPATSPTSNSTMQWLPK